MKLYATISSERATKGQGGNDRIDIQLLGEDKQELGVIALRYQKERNDYFCNYLHNGIIKNIFHIKGERQKGEGSHRWRSDISYTGEKIKICQECGAIKDSDNGIIEN
jgi:hypothetical protein